jgi:hypothetical protein
MLRAVAIRLMMMVVVLVPSGNVAPGKGQTDHEDGQLLLE